MIIQEVEEKLSLHSKHVSEALSFLEAYGLPGLEAGDLEHHQILDVYFDFEGAKLLKKGHYLRFRSDNGDVLVTWRIAAHLQNTVVIDETTHQLNDIGISLAISQMRDWQLLPRYADLISPIFQENLASVGLREIIRVRIERQIKTYYQDRKRLLRIKFDEFRFPSLPGELGSQDHFEFETDVYSDDALILTRQFRSDLKHAFPGEIGRTEKAKALFGLDLLTDQEEAPL